MEQKEMGNMKNRTITVLIVIVVIVTIVTFVGCVELTPTTKIRDIEEHPEKYVNKKVTVEGSVSTPGSGGHPKPARNDFLILDGTGMIGVRSCNSNLYIKPSDRVRVTGTVKTEFNPGIGREIIYIKGDSLKIIKKEGY